MKNWRKDRNFRKQKNDDGTFTYIIMVDGKDVEVSRAIYMEYAAADRKMEYMESDLKRDRVLKDVNGKTVLDENGQPIVLPEREISLDKLVDEDWDYPSSEPSPEDTIIKQNEIKALYACLDLLDDDERALIDALFFNGLTEREYAGNMGLSKTAIHARKEKILKKLKNLINP